jgi:hypothetical protein
MKTIISALILIVVALSVRANDDKYISAMRKNIELLYEAKSTAERQQTVNALERIASAEPTKWEPRYYIAFGYIMMANDEKQTSLKDSYLDQALNAVSKAKELAPNESEVIALEGFVHMIRLTVDPASRGQQYSALAFQSFMKAVNLDADNPRALGLLAQMQYGTAQFFGSPTDEACATMIKALEKFDTFTSENPLAPTWGRPMTESMRPNCEGN